MTTLPMYEKTQDAGAQGEGDATADTAETQAPPRYWLSLESYEDAPGYRERAAREFADGVDELPTTSLSRRGFMQLLGASAALAGASGCDILRRPEKKIVPYAKRPEEILPGIPNHYATAFPRGGYATGVVVKSSEGRPIKVEGNPDHSASGGATSVHAQASILGLYDPDRARTYRRKDGETWKDETAETFSAWAKTHFASANMAQGEGLRVLAAASGSPSMQRVRTALLQRFPKAQWVAWEAVNRDEAFAGAVTAFGRALDVSLRLASADRVLALDSDFSSTEDDAVRNLRAFASRRHVNADAKTTNRLYVVEPHHTPTSTLADHRLRLQAGQVGPFLAAVAGALIADGLEVPGLGAPGRKRLADAAKRTYAKDWHRAVAKDLLAHRGRSAIVVGQRQPAWVHALAHGLNAALGNLGKTVVTVPPVDELATAQTGGLAALVADMRAKKVKTLVVLSQNPVYDAPVDLGFTEALASVGTVVRLGLFEDETSERADWHVPEAHWLASWGDGRGLDGAVALQQPLIAPLYGGVSALEMVARLAGLPEDSGHDLVRATWKGLAPANARSGEAFTAWTRKALHMGVVDGTAYAAAPARANWDRIAAAMGDAGTEAPAASDAMELAFTACAKTFDGRYDNNAWIQELPDPVTKLTWDNAVLISPETAKAKGVKSGDTVSLTADGRTLEAAAWVMAGHADGALTLALGYGRTRSGKTGTGRGFNAYKLRTSVSMGFVRGVTLTKLGGTYAFACVQDHHDSSVNRGSGDMHDRPIVREVPLAKLFTDGFDPAKDMTPKEGLVPDDPETGKPMRSLWKEFDYSKGQQWGMAIDVNACNGCNACVIACQSENNVPVVGKQDVIFGREMHWLRIDRYFVGDVNETAMVHQPMPCQQCQMAPCEQVCPVAATVHTPDGLNDMTYNRCIGTRYCANNCPFKVRRFNYFNYTKRMFASDPLPMANNPDVTVRFRGVMEKCTYCVARVRRAQYDAKNAGKDRVEDGMVTSACAQACPADAIVFGDVNDPETKVSKLKSWRRNYELFPELNLQARTSYLARVRNPNPELV
jgi:molybdopterin-containing oxidoreductase family iron-sulfur binding subunit